MNFRSIGVILAIVIAVLLTPISTYAGSQTGTLTVSASVVGSCTAVSGTLPFGAYSGTKLVVAGNMTLTCTGNTLVNNITLTDGINYLSGTNRRMKGTADPNYINYNIYKPEATVPNISTGTAGTCAASPVSVWGGNGSVGGTSLGFAPANTGRFPSGTTSASITVCGVIPASQTPVPDIYQDTVTITVNFT
jgi:spore coat protein U-like protein